MASMDLAFPFVSKSLISVFKAFETIRDVPILEECRAASLLLPNDFPLWKSVENTFFLEKLGKDVASHQFGESLPALPSQLFNSEAETKELM